MASRVLNVQDVFPTGTSVKAIKQANWSTGQLPPSADVGSADDTKTVAADGTLTFTTLADGTAYFATATVNSVYRAVAFTTPALQQTQTVGAGSLTDLARNRGMQRPGAIAENFNRAGVAGNAAITSGTLRVVGMLMLPAGRPISSITFCSSTQAAVTPTNQWFCLIDPNTRNVLATTVDATTQAWGTTTEKTLNIASALGGSSAGTFTPATDMAVQAGIVIVAATPPNFLAATTSTTLAGMTPALSVNSSVGLTTPASLGAQADVYGAAAGTVPWCYVS